MSSTNPGISPASSTPVHGLQPAQTPSSGLNHHSVATTAATSNLNAATFFCEQILAEDAAQKSLFSRLKDAIFTDEESFQAVMKDIGIAIWQAIYDQLTSMLDIFNIHKQHTIIKELKVGYHKTQSEAAQTAYTTMVETLNLVKILKNTQDIADDASIHTTSHPEIQATIQGLIAHQESLKPFLSKPNQTANDPLAQLKQWAQGQGVMNKAQLLKAMGSFLEMSDAVLDQQAQDLFALPVPQKVQQACADAKINFAVAHNLNEELSPFKQILISAGRIVIRALSVIDYCFHIVGAIFKQLQVFTRLFTFVVSILKLALTGEEMGKSLWNLVQAGKIRQAIEGVLAEFKLNETSLSRKAGIKTKDIELKAALKSVRRHQSVAHKALSLFASSLQVISLLGLIAFGSVQGLVLFGVLGAAALSVANPIGVALVLGSLGISIAMLAYKMARSTKNSIKKSRAKKCLQTAAKLSANPNQLQNQKFKDLPGKYRSLVKKFSSFEPQTGQKKLNPQAYDTWTLEQKQACNDYIHNRAVALLMRYDIDLTVRVMVKNLKAEQPPTRRIREDEKEQYPFAYALQGLLKNEAIVPAFGKEQKEDTEEFLLDSLREGLGLS